MTNKFFILLLIITGASIFYSCRKKDPVAPEPIDYSYFPLDSGRYYVYQVDTIVYDAFKADTTRGSYQLEEVISATITDNSNRAIKKIDCYRRKNDSAAWLFTQTITANLTATTAEVVEDNQRIIKLIFPVVKGKTWNGNAYNTEQVTSYNMYKYSSVGDNVTILGKNYPGTATVVQHDEETLIKKTYAFEQYSPHVGLVFKEFINDSNDQDIQPGVPVTARIKGGVEMRMSLKSYGGGK